MVVPPCGMETKLEPICGREAASAAGSPAHSGTKSRSRQAGEGPADRCAPFLPLACGLLLAACCCFAGVQETWRLSRFAGVSVAGVPRTAGRNPERERGIWWKSGLTVWHFCLCLGFPACCLRLVACCWVWVPAGCNAQMPLGMRPLDGSVTRWCSCLFQNFPACCLRLVACCCGPDPPHPATSRLRRQKNKKFFRSPVTRSLRRLNLLHSGSPCASNILGSQCCWAAESSTEPGAQLARSFATVAVRPSGMALAGVSRASDNARFAAACITVSN
jgi:hypothetical protein